MHKRDENLDKNQGLREMATESWLQGLEANAIELLKEAYEAGVIALKEELNDKIKNEFYQKFWNDYFIVAFLRIVESFIELEASASKLKALEIWQKVSYNIWYLTLVHSHCRIEGDLRRVGYID